MLLKNGTEEILTELKSVMMQSSEDKALIEDKVSSMERDIKEYNQPIKRILKQQDRRTYDKYLMYKMDQVEEEINKYIEAIDTKIKELTKCKEEIDTKIKEITKNKERIAKVEEEISKLRKQILEEEEFLRIGTEYLETIKEKEQKSIELVEVLRKKEQKDIELVEVLRQKERIVTKQIKFMQIIYNDYLAKLEFIKEELREEAEYFGIPIPETNTGTPEFDIFLR